MSLFILGVTRGESIRVTVPVAAIERNLVRVRDRIRAAALRAERDPGAVQIVAVTKTVGLDEIQALYNLGIRNFGENRLQSAREKIERFDGEATWHMIGNVQRRKCPEIIRLFDRVDAVDRLAVAETLNRRCEEGGREAPLPVLIEVNVSGEASKHGFAPEEFRSALDKLLQLKNLHVDGLLTMAPFVEDPEEVRPCFAALYRLAQDYGLQIVSMGMSNDFEVAVEEGATQVRIGSAFFKS